MPKERFFFEQPLRENEIISISQDEFHHLVNVMRAKVKDRIEIVNGMGELATGSVQTIEKKQATLLIEEVKQEAEAPFQIILAQSIPRPNRLDFILEKGTELGMTEIWLFPGKHSERKEFKGNQLDRMHSILVSAMKQCGRLHLPKILIKPELENWKGLEYPAFFGDVEALAPHFIDAFKKENFDRLASKGVIFFIGPETGFSDSETAKLRNLNVKGVKLNGNILRTDTAAIVALALITAC